MTFDELCTLEPQLATLAEDVRAIRDNRRKPAFCANWHWYCNGLRARLIWLVGWRSTHPDARMHTSEAYDVAYDAIYHQLPACRNCACA